jgi:aspartyl-tRNA(Asn)/glutamyl-tRNA(Gln) amidotransferase subunit B
MTSTNPSSVWSNPDLDLEHSDPSSAHSANDRWETVVGLEVHCELKTATKLFCGCRNAFGDEPNTNVCPVCLGLPGSLPVLNSRAVEIAMAIGVALNCEVRPSIFHRKNYFYPDMPKDYQISQYDAPINVDGWLELPDGQRVGIVRAHMEEDTGKTSHVGGGGRIHEANHLLVDYNRAGVPLVEIVSAPDIRSAAQARRYVEELRAILVAIDASDGRMEEGSLRVDANVSIRPVGSEEFGTRCEIKNLNSLRSLARAVEFEARRQASLLEQGEAVVQQTRHWDEDAQKTVPLRSKEEAFDYRYFPEPDLVPLAPDPSWKNEVASALPPMPSERRARLTELLGTKALTVAQTDQVETVVGLDLDPLVVEAISSGIDASLALARTANEAAAHADGARKLDRSNYVSLLRMEQEGKLSATQAKAVLADMVDVVEGGDGGDGGEASPAEIARRKGFEAIESDELTRLVADVAAENPAEWERFATGEDKLASFFTGKVMQKTKGKANGKAVAEQLQRLRAAQSTPS